MKVVIPHEMDYRPTVRTLISTLKQWNLGCYIDEGAPDDEQTIVDKETRHEVDLTFAQQDELLEKLPGVELRQKPMTLEQMIKACLLLEEDQRKTFTLDHEQSIRGRSMEITDQHPKGLTVMLYRRGAQVEAHCYVDSNSRRNN